MLNPDLLKKVITGDDSWVYGYYIETKAHHPMEVSRSAKTEKSKSSSVKCEGFAHCFLLYNGVRHHEFLPQVHAVNNKYYLEAMRRLHKAIRQKRTELWKN